MDRIELTRIRKKHGYSPKQLANLLGVDPSYLSLIESGKRPVSDSIKYKIEKMEEHLAMDSGVTYDKTKVIDKTGGSLIPYYDVDVLASPIEVFNDQTTVPTFKIDLPGFADCDFAINVAGHSMYPTIESGTMILCKRLLDKTLIVPGEIYFIVTEDYRMVKRLKKSEKKGHVIAASDNHNGHASPDGQTYGSMEIPLEKILFIYLVKGNIKRHQI